MNKRFYILLFALCLVPAMALAQNWKDPKYLAGAVPVNEQGVVVFSHDYSLPGKSRYEIITALRNYAKNVLMTNENALKENCRILDTDEPKEQLAVRMDEYLVFKRTAWVLHRTRFLYDLVFTVRDGGYSVVMQRIRYLYLEQEYEGAEPERRTAEDWITDAEALSPKGKLLKKTRKFRVFTIDRKDAVFAEAYAAAQK